MPPNPGASAHALPTAGILKRLVGGLSIFTMLMTIPQVLTIWISHQAAGVSTLSWSALECIPFLCCGLALVRLTETRQEYLRAVHRLDSPRWCRTRWSFRLSVMNPRGTRGHFPFPAFFFRNSAHRFLVVSPIRRRAAALMECFFGAAFASAASLPRAFTAAHRFR
jgi:hypothetical protein